MYYDKEVQGTRPPTIECRVYASDADEPPDFPDDPSKSGLPVSSLLRVPIESTNLTNNTTPGEGLARPLLTLTIDLGDIPELPTKLIGGRTYYHVDFEIHMTLRSADLEFVLGRGRKRYKPQRVNFSRMYADG